MRYQAWLALDDDSLANCALSDISDTGARIDVDDADTVPERFTLLLSGNGMPRRKCSVVWRKERQIGVQFERRLPADERAGLVPEDNIDPYAAYDLPENA
jgi:hypothetical protein